MIQPEQLKNRKGKRYKYLIYLPPPLNLRKDEYDLVDDPEFLDEDGRIPLLIATQFGIFPSGSTYKKYPYERLEGLDGQRIGLIGRGYASNRERKGVYELFLDDYIMGLIREERLFLDLRLWYDRGVLREEGPYLDLKLMSRPLAYR